MIQCNAVQVCQINTNVEKLLLRKISSGGGSYSDNPGDIDMMVFQPR